MTLKLQKFKINLEFNTLASGVFNAKLSQANFEKKTNFDNTVSSLDSKIAKNKTKNKSIKNELKKLKHLIWVILLVRASFKKKMVYQII